MRYSRWLLMAAVAAALVAGCADTRKARREQFGQQIDQARRLFNHATALMADPQYLDKTTGAVSPVERRLKPDEVDVPATQPIEKTQVVDTLQEARDILVQALAEHRDAGVGDLSDAQLLLGQVQFSRGMYHLDNAERCRTRMAAPRRQATFALEMLREDLSLADLSRSLGQLPKDKIQQMRDQTVKDRDRLQSDIKGAEGEVARLQKDNDALSKENESTLQQAARLRQESDRASGQQGLALVKQAHQLEEKAADYSSRMAANTQAIQAMQVDKAFLQERLRAAEAKLTVYDARMGEMDKESQAMAAEVKAALDRAGQNWQQVRTAAEGILKDCKEAAEQERLALEALASAADGFDQAAKGIAQEVNQARSVQRGAPRVGEEVLEARADDQHLASAIASKGSSGLAAADLRARQAATAEANAALADNMADALKRLGREPLALVAALKNDYLPDLKKTRDQALADYKSAEAELEKVISQHLKYPPGRNVNWIYQGELASAYLGHYRLTWSEKDQKGDETILAKARQFVGEALRDKQTSPYLASVVELRKLIQPAGAGPTTAP